MRFTSVQQLRSHIGDTVLMPKTSQSKRSQRPLSVNFNHALIYVKTLDPALHFYRDLLGFREIETIPGEYSRLQSRGSPSTLALHVSGSRDVLAPGGVWLYLEVKELDRLYRQLRKSGIHFSQKPEQMPWGWKQAFLKDPDGHKLCLYRAGNKRLRKTRNLESL
jgi:uncharacterized glyoxalase superfamily protein PhnB